MEDDEDVLIYFIPCLGLLLSSVLINLKFGSTMIKASLLVCSHKKTSFLINLCMIQEVLQMKNPNKLSSLSWIIFMQPLQTLRWSDFRRICHFCLV